MSLVNGQVPKFAVDGPFTASGTLNAASAGALGADTNGVTVCTVGSFGGRVTALVLNTDDTAAVNVLVYIKNGSTIKPLGIVNVAASSGNLGTVAAVDALIGSGVTLVGMPVDNTGKRFIHLGASEELKISALANMTAAKKLYATAIYSNYVN